MGHVADHLVDKFDEVVADGPGPLLSPTLPSRSAKPEPATKPPAESVIAFEEALRALQEDVRQGLGSAAQIQLDALASLRLQVAHLAAELVVVKDSLPPAGAADGVAPPADLVSLRPQLELVHQELRRDRDQRETLRASVLEAVGGLRTEVQALRAQFEATSEEEAASRRIPPSDDLRAILAELRDLVQRNRDAVAAPANDDRLNEVMTSLSNLRAEDERARETAATARRDLMHTLEAFHDELVEQWRERKVFEASLPGTLEGLRRSVAEGVTKLSTVASVAAAVEANWLDAPPADDQRAPQLMTAVDSFQATVEALQADVRDLHTFLSMVASNLQRYHDAVVNGLAPAREDF